MQSGPSYRMAVRRALMLLAAAGFALGAFLVATIPPSEDTLYPRCQFHSLTGWHCPGCGTTRALHAAFNGRFAQAFAYNALAFVVVPIVGWALARSLWNWYRERSPSDDRDRSAKLWTIVLVALLIAYGIARNIPAYPFTLLAPHQL
jgi:hypothetical protein